MSEDTLQSLGCDYITVTATHEAGKLGLQSQASALFRHQAELGNAPRAWAMSGFKGWQCGSVQVGIRDELVMTRLSSDAAYTSWRSVALKASNVTRFDLQATIRLDGDVDERLSANRHQALLDAKKHKDQRIVRWVQDNRGGFTLYLGSRQSLAFGRVYNKFAESGLDHYRNCLRYEVEFKGKLAHTIVRTMLSNHSEKTHVASYVSQFFQGRAVHLELMPNATATYCCSRPRSDVDRNLLWLQNAVRPTVSRLIALGKGEEVLRALGLIEETER